MKTRQSNKSTEKAVSVVTPNLRRWILKAVTTADGKTGASLPEIKKFLNSKEDGLSKRPEVKIVLKKLIDSGHIVRTDGKYTARDRIPRKAISKKVSTISTPKQKFKQEKLSGSSNVKAPITARATSTKKRSEVQLVEEINSSIDLGNSASKQKSKEAKLSEPSNAKASTNARPTSIKKRSSDHTVEEMNSSVDPGNSAPKQKSKRAKLSGSSNTKAPSTSKASSNKKRSADHTVEEINSSVDPGNSAVKQKSKKARLSGSSNAKAPSTGKATSIDTRSEDQTVAEIHSSVEPENVVENTAVESAILD